MVEFDHFFIPTSLRAEGLGFHDDQIHVRILPFVASAAGAEEVHLLRIDCVEDRPYHPVHESVGDSGDE